MTTKVASGLICYIAIEKSDALENSWSFPMAFGGSFHVKNDHSSLPWVPWVPQSRGSQASHHPTCQGLGSPFDLSPDLGSVLYGRPEPLPFTRRDGDESRQSRKYSIQSYEWWYLLDDYIWINMNGDNCWMIINCICQICWIISMN